MTDDRKYRINPDFVRPEPTAAKFFCTLTEEEYRDPAVIEPIYNRWRVEGVKLLRVTLINDENPNPPYPHGVWIEGWLDSAASPLPFGEPEEPGGAIYPPLTSETGKLHAAV